MISMSHRNCYCLIKRRTLWLMEINGNIKTWVFLSKSDWLLLLTLVACRLIKKWMRGNVMYFEVSGLVWDEPDLRKEGNHSYIYQVVSTGQFICVFKKAEFIQALSLKYAVMWIISSITFLRHRFKTVINNLLFPLRCYKKDICFISRLLDLKTAIVFKDSLASLSSATSNEMNEPSEL